MFCLWKPYSVTYPWAADTCPVQWHRQLLPHVSIPDWGHFVRVQLVLRHLLVDSQLTSPNDTLTSPALLIHTSTGSTWLKWPLKPAQIEITLLIRVSVCDRKSSVKTPITNLQKNKGSQIMPDSHYWLPLSTLFFCCLLSRCLSRRCI